MPEKVHLETAKAEGALTAAELEIAKLKGYTRDLKKRIKRLEEECHEREERFESLAAIRDVRKWDKLPIVGEKEKDNVIPGVLWSDWHVAEVVKPERVQGRNHYNPDTARERVRKCAENTILQLRSIKQSARTNTVCLWLLGDWISGYLHPELAETNAMGPVREARYAEKLLMEALGALLEEKWIKKLHVTCLRGNHGRTTKRIQFKNDYETSYESWIYWHIADVFSRQSNRIVFDIPEGDVSYTEVDKGFMVRGIHGHQVRYSDGVGGLSIPLNKWQAKQDKTQRAQFNVMGHYHQWSAPNNSTMLNGSLKGWDEYAASHGFSYEPPMQGLFVMDRTRRAVTSRIPIFCD